MLESMIRAGPLGSCLTGRFNVVSSFFSCRAPDRRASGRARHRQTAGRSCRARRPGLRCDGTWRERDCRGARQWQGLLVGPEPVRPAAPNPRILAGRRAAARRSALVRTTQGGGEQRGVGAARNRSAPICSARRVRRIFCRTAQSTISRARSPGSLGRAMAFSSSSARWSRARTTCRETASTWSRP